MARWHSCNILNFAPDAKRLWQFDAKGDNYVLARETRVAHVEPIPAKLITKSWTSLWQPRLNVACLPPESLFLKVVELPASNFEELLAMVEFQLEKLSPVPVVQVLWTMHLLPSRRPAVPAASPEGAPAENLQTVVVVLVDRKAVEQFLGKLAEEKYQPDRLEVPWLDQLDAIGWAEDGIWVLPLNGSSPTSALTVWQCDGVIRHLSFINLPATGDRAAEFKHQLELVAWSGEVEGWLAPSPQWHLIADPTVAPEWEGFLKNSVEGLVHVAAPLPPMELAARTARRAAHADARANLLPADYILRYRQQFFDRLWLRGLLAAGVMYGLFLVLYFAAVSVLDFQTVKKERAVAALGGSYTNSLQLSAQYDVLKDREDLKFAALDCWKLVADQLPADLTLQQFNFSDGRKLSLSGTCSSDQLGLIIDKDKFYDRVRKAQRNGQFIFNQDPTTGSQLMQHAIGTTGNYTWNFGLELVRAEAAVTE
jgi:hypothetical protein